MEGLRKDIRTFLGLHLRDNWTHQDIISSTHPYILLHGFTRSSISSTPDKLKLEVVAEAFDATDCTMVGIKMEFTKDIS